jgi:murein DD-endopeptidase MepM/ murein hydrolase activator NlpD
MRQQLRSAQGALDARSGDVAKLSHELDNAKADHSKLQAIATDRDKAVQEQAKAQAERDRLQAKVAGLEKQLADLGTASRRPPPAAGDPRDAGASAAPQPAAPSPAKAAALGASLGPSGGQPRPTAWAEIEEVLTTAGVDFDHVLTRLGAVPPGQGGPFVALKGIKQNAPTQPGLDEGLQKIVHSLPFTAPLPDYQIESHFGPRIDPFNHRRSFHAGLDLSAAFKSPVYATAPGTVSFAGPKGEFGKVVEIDHGSGIVTRYAHLHRIAVALGQKVAGHQQIGLLGSTGRSSGPHVHYEVIVNGTSRDPEPFLNAGSHIIQVSAKK